MTEQLFSGAILAADAVAVVVAVIVGLAWLLPAHLRDQHGEIRFFRRLIQFAAQFSILMLAVSVGSGIAVGIPWDAWAGMPHWLIYTLPEAAPLIPGVILVAAMRAVPVA